MKKRETRCSYLEDPAAIEAKRQRQSAERQKRYLSREKQKAIALMRKKRRVRLALEGFVDVFKVLPRSDLNTLEFSCSTFHSIVSTHMNGVCLVAIGDVRVDHRLGYIVTNCVAKFRAIDEGHADAAPAGQKHFRENVYVLLQRVVSKCFVEMLVVTFPADLDDVAFKALTAIQSNVSCVIVDGRHENTKAIADTATLDVACSALFGFPLVIFRTFRAPYEVFTGHAVKRAKHWEAYNLLLDAPMDQDRYHDKDLIALFSVDSGNRGTVINLQGLRLSSEFVLRIIEAHTANVLRTKFSCSIRDSMVDEQKRGTHNFTETEDSFGRTSALDLVSQNLPRLHVNLTTDRILIERFL